MGTGATGIFGMKIDGAALAIGIAAGALLAYGRLPVAAVIAAAALLGWLRTTI